MDSLYGDICQFLEKTLLFDNSQSWRGHIRQIDSEQELAPAYNASNGRWFIQDLVYQCWNWQFTSGDYAGKYALEVLLLYVATKVGVDKRNILTSLIERWHSEPTTLQPTLFSEHFVAPIGMPRPGKLIGREAELNALMEGLRHGTSYGVFAIHGKAGIGKTALAAEAVARLSIDPAFPGKALWIPCQGLQGDEGLAEISVRVASALRLGHIVSILNPRARQEALTNALRQRQRTLIALDNIERGSDVEALLQFLVIPDHVSLLVTSRQNFEVANLKPITLDPLSDEFAERLFLQNLKQNDPNRGGVNEIEAIRRFIKLLDKIPLVIELEAAYIAEKQISFETAIEYLQAKIPSDIPALHTRAVNSVALTLERIMGILSKEQQRFFASLAFLSPAGFPRDVALTLSATIDGTGERREDGDTQENLENLIKISLIEQLVGSSSRLRLHPSVWEYADNNLSALKQEDPIQYEALGDAVTYYWLAFANHEEVRDNITLLENEATGIIRAIRWSQVNAIKSPDRYDNVIRLARLLYYPWKKRGRRKELRDILTWSRDAAARTGDDQSECWARLILLELEGDAVRSEAMMAGYGSTNWTKFDQGLWLNHATQEYNRISSLSAQITNKEFFFAAKRGQAQLFIGSGDFDKARDILEITLLDVLKHWPHPSFEEQITLLDLGILAFRRDQIPEARHRFKESLEVAASINASQTVTLRWLGRTLIGSGEIAEGRQLLLSSLSLSEQEQNIYGIGKCEQYLGELDEQDGHAQMASAHYARALECLDQMQAPEVNQVRSALTRVSGHTA
jgi:hypothetical protein